MIGAGRAQFGFDMLGDLFRNPILSGCQVVLHDINPTGLEHMPGRSPGARGFDIAPTYQAYAQEHSLKFL